MLVCMWPARHKPGALGQAVRNGRVKGRLCCLNLDAPDRPWLRVAVGAAEVREERLVLPGA
jgi:hypothetical protein